MIGRCEQAISEEERTRSEVLRIRQKSAWVCEEEDVRVDEDDLTE
jgi:hypothetical protein